MLAPDLMGYFEFGSGSHRKSIGKALRTANETADLNSRPEELGLYDTPANTLGGEYPENLLRKIIRPVSLLLENRQ